MAHTLIETEVKFWVESLGAVRDRLMNLGAIQVGERVLETNIRLDRPDRSLSASGQALRLRRSQPSPPTSSPPSTGLQPGSGEGTKEGRAFTSLTYKARLAGPGGEIAPVKELEEIEVQVSDFHRMQAILERLGFEPIFLYEKYRETFRLDEVEVMLDELPYGCFVEIEGQVSAIDRAAAQLGLAAAQRVPGTYLSLFETLRQRRNLPFRDLTFANFRELHITPADLGVSLFPTLGLPGRREVNRQ
ncbi:MAG: adenylate cyclase [Chloroflexota bacterium]|mgnify:CR=1 FL=1